jgi:hypothetical protein
LKPIVLVATTSPPHWFSAARLAMGLANAGFTVEAVCPPGHSLNLTKAVRRTHLYHSLAPTRSFAAAIAAAVPDLIVPTDDFATQHLHKIYQQERLQGKAGDRTCVLIERSLGAPESFPIVYARTMFMDFCRQEGVRVPETKAIADVNVLKYCIGQIGLPAVLKADRTSGGDGVRIVRTWEEAERAFRGLQAPPHLARAVKRALVDRDTTLILPVLRRTRSVVNLQAFLVGRDATSLIASRKGTVLAGLYFEVVAKQDSTGPATVLRLIENAEMILAAQKMAHRLNLSGLHGFDFVLEEQTGKAHLIEINPRATQVGHLALGPGRDLPAALYAMATGETVHEAQRVTDNDTITLFPQEWIRNPAIGLHHSGYHDIPWEEPELVRACLRSRQKRRIGHRGSEWSRVFSRVYPPQP